MLAPVFIWAQVPVVESDAVSGGVTQSSAQQAADAEVAVSGNANSQLFYQLQLLQEEVLRMQGLLEQQQYEIDRLKQQHLDDFVAIDKRLSEMRAATPSAKAVVAPAPNDLAGTSATSEAPISQGSANAAAASVVAAAPGANDQEAYRKAYDLIKQKDFDGAEDAFENFLQDHPNSPYVGNALYWLGELYILDLDYTNAEMAFNTIIEQHPDHPKVAEAHYKLGKIYFDQGKKDQSKQQMEIVVQQYAGKAGHVVQLAKDFLNKHFS